MLRSTVRAFAVVTFLLLLPAAAHAQYTSSMSGVSWNNPMSAYLDSSISLSIQRSAFDRTMRAKYGGEAAAGANATTTDEPAAAHLSLDATDFKGAKKRLIVDALTRPEGATPEQQAVLKQIYATGFTEFEKAGRKNNVAYALAFSIGVSLMVYRGSELSDAESDAMVWGINDALGRAPAFNKLTPRQKQTLYEASIITGSLIFTFAKLGENDEEMAKLSKQLAKQVLGQFGL